VTGFAKGTFSPTNFDSFFELWKFITFELFHEATLMGYHLRWKEALSVLGVRFYSVLAVCYHVNCVPFRKLVHNLQECSIIRVYLTVLLTDCSIKVYRSARGLMLTS